MRCLEIIPLFICCILFYSSNYAQDGIPVPPEKENNYYFSIKQFNRQPEPPNYLQHRIDAFSKKPKSKWNQEDSLYYAYEKVHLEEFGFALSIFVKLNMDTISDPHAQQLYRTSLLQTGRYDDLLEYNKKVIPADTTAFFSVKDAILMISEAYLARSNNDGTSVKDTIFKLLYSDTMKTIRSSNRAHRALMIETAKNIDSALRYFTFLHDRRDTVLAQLYEEFGDFQKDYFYISNAYLCYAIARHYNRNDKDLANKYNRAIDRIAEKNYLLPSFRTVFGKVIDNRYQLSEKLTELKKDTIDPKENFKPPVIEKRKDYLPWLDTSEIILIGLFIVLFIVILFVRSSKDQ